MEPRIQNGFLRAIIFMPLWMIIMGITSGLGVFLFMLMNGINLNADPDAATALFDNISFDSPVMLFLTACQVAGSFIALWTATKFIDRKPLMSIGLSIKDKSNEMLDLNLAFLLLV
jgi:hypothetical protein